VFHAVVLSEKEFGPFVFPRFQMPPSRQERRKAERDAAKRAPARAGAAGAAGAAADLANLDVNAGGDWKTQAEGPAALGVLGAAVVKRRAGAYTRSLFSSNLSAFCGIGGALRDSLRVGVILRVFGRCRQMLGVCSGIRRVYFVSDTAQVELKSGRV